MDLLEEEVSDTVKEGRWGKSRDVEERSREEILPDFLRARGKKPRFERGRRAISVAVVWPSRRTQWSWVQGCDDSSGCEGSDLGDSVKPLG